MRRIRLLRTFFSVFLLAALCLSSLSPALAQPLTDTSPPGNEVKQESIPENDVSLVSAQSLGLVGEEFQSQEGSLADLPQVILGQDFINEIEPNGAYTNATSLGSNNAVALGYVYPNGDLDFYSFTAQAGDRVYAATMTSFSASGSTDSYLDLIASDGITVLESDNDDGSFGSLSSSIAGASIPASGTYYLKVRHNSATSQLRPYHLHFQLQSGAPVPETEPNDNGQLLPPSGWVTGTISSTADADIFALSLNAGDTVFLSLDLDPERDGVTWNGQLGLGQFNGYFLVVNDGSTTSPNSEAFFMTVRQTGFYYVLVNAPSTTFGTYNLSVSVQPAAPGNCTTYTSADVPKVIPTGPGVVTSTLTIPGNPRIEDFNVSIDLDHTYMQDLDVTLVSPAGNENGLFSDIGSGTQITMGLGLDDEAGIPIGTYSVVRGMINQPEYSYRLSWFDGEDAGGTWTLVVRDDASGDGGNLYGWGVTVCEPPPLPSCPVGTQPVTLFTTDFEANDGGFTHSGTQDEWQWGTPIAPPVNGCNSGSNCWKTDLTGQYNASSDQDLLSPNILLSGIVGPVTLSWAQKYQMESASFDHAFLDVQQVGGANPQRLWEWRDATMTNSVGSPSVSIQESGGWGTHTADLSSYLGDNIELLFHLDSDSSVNLGGLAVDDVTVTGCQLPTAPAIYLQKTVGTDPQTCATTDTIAVLPGTDVTYCYQVTNTGSVTFTLHDLSDSLLGNILTGFNYSLGLGASAFVTQTVNITQATVNTATWTAYNPGPTDVVSDTDTASVTILTAPAIGVTPSSLTSDQYADVVMTKTLNIANSGDQDLMWSIDEAPGSLARLLNWSDNFDSYATGSQLHGQGGWKGWGNDPAAGAFAVDDQARSVPNSAQILGATDLVHEYAGYTSGMWTYRAWQYIPGTYTGQTYFILLNQYDDPGNTNNWSTQVCFNATDHLLYDDVSATCAAGASLPIVYDQWVEIRVEIDLDANLQTFYYDNQMLYQDSWTEHVSGGGIANIGAVDLFANNASAVYYDDISLIPTGAGPCALPGDLPWVATVPISGTTGPGGSDPVGVVFDSTGLAPNTYTGNLCVNSNDPVTPQVTVPLTLTVLASPAIEVMPSSLGSSQYPDVQTILPLTISNTGSADLMWSILEESNQLEPAIGIKGPVHTVPRLSGTHESWLPAAGEEQSQPEVIGPSWETMAPLPSPRVFNAVIADLNGYIYVMGGTSDAGGSIPTDTNFRYNTMTDSWDTMAALPAPVGSIDGMSIGGKIYVPGDGSTDDTFVYDIASDSWTIIPANNGYSAREQYQVVAIGTDLYVLGGITTASAASTTEVWVLDTTTGMWSAGVPMQNSRTSFSAAAMNGNIYVAGGVAYPGFVPDMTAEMFDGSSWSYIANVPNGGGAYTRWSYNADGLGADGLWLAAGRRDAGWTIINHAGYYDPATNSWTDSPTVPTLNQGRVYMEGDVAVDGYYYVIGGRNPAGSVLYADNERLRVGAACQPSDVPWLSVSPTSGTTLPGMASMVDVTLDSTGLDVGTYHGNLCVASNDPFDPALRVPVSLTVEPIPPAPAIVITKTVGTDAGVCATTDTITVTQGTSVYYCYEVTNTGNITLTLHDLQDDQLGSIFSGLMYDLAPGASVNTVSAGVTVSATMDTVGTVTNVGTWTAYNAGPTEMVTATASATVYVTLLHQPGISLVKTVGTDAGVCASTDAITVTEGTTVYYCYEVTNTGNITLSLHDLEDDMLGTIFSGLAYDLAPGASVNTVAAGLEISATMDVTGTVTNVGTWTAYNAGPTDEVMATASATVNVMERRYVVFLPILFR